MGGVSGEVERVAALQDSQRYAPFAECQGSELVSQRVAKLVELSACHDACSWTRVEPVLSVALVEHPEPLGELLDGLFGVGGAALEFRDPYRRGGCGGCQHREVAHFRGAAFGDLPVAGLWHIQAKSVHAADVHTCANTQSA